MAFNGRGGPTAQSTGLPSAGATSNTSTQLPRRLHPSPQKRPVSGISALLSKRSGESSITDNLEVSAARSYARKELLGDTSFGNLGALPSAPEESLEDMQKKDPLATQVWKLYSKQKGTLPNAERMENLTWRMMALTLRRERFVSFFLSFFLSFFFSLFFFFFFFFLFALPPSLLSPPPPPPPPPPDHPGGF